MMKIKYIISIESKLEQNILMGRIISKLEDEYYIIVDKSIDTVLFKDDSWQIRPQNKIFSKIDKGKFEVSALDYGKLITITYYVSFLPEVVTTTILVVISIVVQNYFVILISLPLLIQLLVRISTLKSVINQMLKRLAI